MISRPIPTCSPCNAFVFSFNTFRSHIWDTICSAPDTGRGLSTICIHSPDRISAYISFSIASLSPKRISSSTRLTSLSAFSSRSHTSSQIYSSVIRCAIFQSRIEIYFPRKSDTPDAVSLDGAAAKISVSARIQRGETPATVFFNPSSVNAATFAANPSTLASVGTDTNGISYSVAA